MTNKSQTHTSLLQRVWWNLVYLTRKTPWDTGITPPEVRTVVESGQVSPGRALDLGCGTGTNVIYLVQHSFETVGVDLSSRAIAQAQRKIRQARLAKQAQVYAGDVTQLDKLPIEGLFDLALDIGCLHSVDPSARQQYAQGLIRRMQPGGLYLLCAFGPRPGSVGRMGITPEQVAQLFAPALSVLQVTHGQDQGRVASAWYTLQKVNSP
jgi:SAM-dependent methyltransferase